MGNKLVYNVRYYDTGNKLCEHWFQNDILHRLDGPAVILYDENGYKSYERWYQNGKPHRLDGPALINYNNGSVLYGIWYHKGIQLTNLEIKNIYVSNILPSLEPYFDEIRLVSIVINYIIE